LFQPKLPPFDSLANLCSIELVMNLDIVRIFAIYDPI
jgi:hypothetical protein